MWGGAYNETKRNKQTRNVKPEKGRGVGSENNFQNVFLFLSRKDASLRSEDFAEKHWKKSQSKRENSNLFGMSDPKHHSPETLLPSHDPYKIFCQQFSL